MTATSTRFTLNAGVNASGNVWLVWDRQENKNLTGYLPLKLAKAALKLAIKTAAVCPPCHDHA